MIWAAVPSLVAMTLEESAIAAWLAGEDELFEQRIGELEAFVETSPAMRNGVGYLLECARGRGLRARPRNERPATRAIAMLVAAALTPDAAERRAHLDRAILEADSCGQPRPMIFARLARAALDPVDAGARRDEALAITLGTCSMPAREHFASAAEGVSPLQPFVQRFAATASGGDVSIELLEGTVTVGGTPIRIPEKEFALLAALALADAPLDRDLLIETLWPDVPPRAAGATLRVYVSRVRSRLQDAAAISADKQRYRLSERIVTDFAKIEAFTQQLPEKPTTREIDTALRSHAALLAGPPAFLLDLPALAPLHARVNVLLDRVESWLQGARWRVPEQTHRQIRRALADTAG